MSAQAGGAASLVERGGGSGGHRLEPLFFPRRVVIAGFSERPGTWGRLAYGFLRQAGFKGEVLALRPRHSDTEVPALSSLEDAGPVDLLLVAVPAAGAVEVVAEAAAAGVGGAVVFSAGFAEEGDEGARLQQRLVDAAGTMPMLGPNCLGLVSDPASVVAAVSGFLTRPRRSGPIALVSQSGAMGFVLAEQLRRRGAGFSFYASTGNEATVGVPEVLGYLAARPEVRVIGCYLEGIRDVASWRRSCSIARDLGVAVVALKVGLSPGARRAALSHTAAIAGEVELFEAVAREEGVTLVGDEVSFTEAVCSLGRPGLLPARPRMGVVTMSGGGGAMVADQMSRLADTPELSVTTRERLRSLGVALAGDANPVDLTGMFSRHLDRLDEVIRTVASDPRVDIMALYFTFGDQLVDNYRALGVSLENLAVPTWFVWAGAPEGEVERLAPTGRVVPNIPCLVSAVAAQPRRADPELCQVLDACRSRQQAQLAASQPRALDLTGSEVLTELVVAPWLESAGMPGVTRVVGSTPEAVVEEVRAERLRPPLVVKVDHPLAPHRARLGLVRTNVADVETLGEVCAELLRSAAVAGLEGATLLVEPMVGSTASLAVGAMRHRDYGDILLVGPGGELAEAAGYRRAAACLPLSPAGLEALLDAASAAAGRPVEPAALTEVLVAVEAFFVGHPGVAELDVNPILLTPEGTLVAVDALAVAARSDEPPTDAGSAGEDAPGAADTTTHKTAPAGDEPKETQA